MKDGKREKIGVISLVCGSPFFESAGNKCIKEREKKHLRNQENASTNTNISQKEEEPFLEKKVFFFSPSWP